MLHLVAATTPTVIDHVPTLKVTFSIAALTFVLANVAPLLTAVVTQSTWHPAVKAVLNAALAAAGALIAIAAKTDGTIDVSYFVFMVGWACVVAFATYKGFWKPTTVAPRLHAATDLPGTKAKLQRAA